MMALYGYCISLHMLVRYTDDKLEEFQRDKLAKHVPSVTPKSVCLCMQQCTVATLGMCACVTILYVIYAEVLFQQNK